VSVIKISAILDNRKKLDEACGPKHAMLRFNILVDMYAYAGLFLGILNWGYG